METSKFIACSDLDTSALDQITRLGRCADKLWTCGLRSGLGLHPMFALTLNS